MQAVQSLFGGKAKAMVARDFMPDVAAGSPPRKQLQSDAAQSDPQLDDAEKEKLILRLSESVHNRRKQAAAGHATDGTRSSTFRRHLRHLERKKHHE